MSYLNDSVFVECLLLEKGRTKGLSKLLRQLEFGHAQSVESAVSITRKLSLLCDTHFLAGVCQKEGLRSGNLCRSNPRLCNACFLRM